MKIIRLAVDFALGVLLLGLCRLLLTNEEQRLFVDGIED